jgi:2OG-Fe(II) oxygenase superfamily
MIQMLKDRQKALVGGELDARRIRELAMGTIAAVQVAKYYPEDFSHLLAQRLLGSPLFGHYANAPDIGRVGQAYFETIDDPEKREVYYANAATWIRALRDLCAPFACPMDTLRLQLQETWPAGATLETIDNRPMFVGLARVFENGAGAHPHQDVLARDAPAGCARARTLRAQLAANVYLKPAASGGELEIWLRKPTNGEYETLRMPGSYGVDRTLIGEPDLVLTPRTGDLILFNAHNLHAVRPAGGGPRITMSTFIGYRGQHQPLTYCS